MNQEQNSPFNPTPKKECFFLVVILLYVGFHGYVNYLQNPSEERIGYMDFVYWSRPLHDLLQGKVLFKDFFYYYGPLYAFIQVPFYDLFGANHWALLMNLRIIMPLLSIFLAHLYIRVFIKLPLLRISFVLVCIFQLTVGVYEAGRHICAELTLALFFFCLTRPDKKVCLFFTGIMQGVSILMDFPYGFSALIAICTTFTLFAISNTKVHAKALVKLFLSGLLISLTPFTFYMVYHGVLLDFLKDYYLYVTSFMSTHPPGSDAMIPAFPRISLSNLSESLNHFLVSQAFRQYLPLLLYGGAGLVFIVRFYRGGDPSTFKLFLLSCYGLLIFYRSLVTPAYNYMAYGFVPAITIGFIVMEFLCLRATHHYNNYNFQTGYKLKDFLGYCLCSIILSFTFIWFSQTIEYKGLFKFNPGKEKSTDMIYYKKVGFKISKEAYDQYTMINNYIEQNVSPDEYILTYPWGYYSRFTGRPNVLNSHDAVYGTATKRKEKHALKQLKERRPPLVILNTLNSDVSIGAVRGDTPGQVSWRTEDSPLFAGHENSIKLYILENYHLHKKFKIASILKRNKKKKPFDRTFKTTEIDTENIETIRHTWEDSHAYEEIKPVTGNIALKIKNRKVRIEYILKEPQYATHIDLKFLIDQNIYKRFLSKSRLRLGITDSSKKNNLAAGCCLKNTEVVHAEQVLSDTSIAEWNRIKVQRVATYVPIKDRLKKISSFWIEVETPKPYLLPHELRIISIKLLFDERIKLD